MAYDHKICERAAFFVNEAYKISSDPDGRPHTTSEYYQLTGLFAQPRGWFAHKELYCWAVGDRITGKIYLVFPGTRTFNDWLSNFKFKQIQDPDKLMDGVESGAANIYLQMLKPIRQLVAIYRDHLVITGHSLGAQLATLACWDNRVDCGYLFASPRVGSIAWAEKFDAKFHDVYRILNTEDLVPTMPLPAATGVLLRAFSKLTFQHIGKPYCFTKNTGDIINNHHMETYIAGLKGEHL